LSKLHPSTSPLGILIVVAVVYVATIALIERRGLWIIDNQIKFLQVEQIVESNARDYSLPWAGASFDPELRFPPLVFPFYAAHEGKVYPAYSPVFPLLSAGPYALFGIAGLYLLPLAGGLLTLLGVARLARLSGVPPGGQSAAVLLCGLLTPLWFYSAVFWEHSVAVAACVWGLGFVCRFQHDGSWRSLAIGSALCATGIYFRDDLYVFCAALALVTSLTATMVGPRDSLAVWSRRLRIALLMGAVMLVALVPLWLFQGWAVGHPFGFHIGVHVLDFPGLGAHLASRAAVFYALFVQSHREVWVSIALAAPFLIGFAIRPRLDDRAFNIAVPMAAMLALAAFAVTMAGYFSSASPLLTMLRANGVFAASPILILAFLRRKGEPDSFLSGFLWKLALVYTVLYCLVSPLDATRGVHWGNRLVLVLYPVFGLMAAETLLLWSRSSGGALPRLALGITAAASLAAQAYSIVLLDLKQEVTVRINETVAARPEHAILTDVWWVPLELYTLFRERPIFLVDSQEEMNEILTRMAGNGYEACLLVTEPSRPVSLTPVAVIEDDKLNLRSLKLLRIDLTR
jgi:hypothetical protein